VKRLLALLTVVLALAAVSSAGHGSSAQAACGGGPQACGGGSCSWAGPIPPGGLVNACYGYWTSGYLTTSGCCAGGTSHTGFILGYTDDRWNDVSNLHIYARYPAQQESFQMWNKSSGWVWYSVQVQ
jgi:hypothetical protein